MILTVTLNPSVDISYKIDTFHLNESNRCDQVIKTAGGKGLNVARVLKQLGGEVVATGFLGGPLGEFIKNQLDAQGINNDFLMTQKPTRNCIAILSGGVQTEILEAGPIIEEKEQDVFLEKYSSLCKKVDIVDISGSAPRGVKSDFVEKLIEIAKKNHCIVIADVSGILLEKIVFEFKEKPYAIKPNLEEFKALIQKMENIDIKEELLKNTQGIDFVMLTCSSQGAVIKDKKKVYKVEIPEINCVNPVGSGDSSVAGLAYALDKKMDMKEAVALANACGMSNCMQEKTGYIDVKDVHKLKEQIYFEEM